MCACRCGIRVHLKDGRIRYIEGNRNHPVNKGVLCGKGSAGIMQQYSPAKLRKPLRRIGPRGSGEFEEIEWEEALATATGWLHAIRESDPRKLAFFTGRDQSQALTGWWASQFGTPNYAAHGGFCSVNMAAAGLYTIGGSFWEFGEPDWERTRYLLMFGVAEDHDSNPIKIGLGKLKSQGSAKFVSVNPIRTGYSAIADEWIGIRPGTDGLFVLAIIQELLRAGKIDEEYLRRYTNAAWLVVQSEGAADHGLFVRDETGQPLVFDEVTQAVVSFNQAGIRPRLSGNVRLSDGRDALPSFHLVALRCLEPQYSADAVAPKTGVDAAVIRRIAAELAHAAFEQTVEIAQPWTDWTGRTHDKMVGRPVAMHAMRGISAHSNGFHTCRAIHLLQMMLGSIDTPGGFRYKPPFPRPTLPGIKPTGRSKDVTPGKPMPGPPLGFPASPQDLLVEPDGSPSRIDRAFSWEAPLAVHGVLHEVIRNAWAADPYPIDTLFMFMANMSWNSSMNTAGTIEMLTDKNSATGEYRIPRIIYSDAFASEMVAYADLVLPDTTYLERWDCISLLDRPISDADGVADSIRQPVIPLDRDVRPFQDVLIDLGARLHLPGLVREDGSPRYPGGYADYIVHHERKPGVGMLAGWRGATGGQSGIGPVNERQLDAYIANQCFWREEVPEGARYFKHVNRKYLQWATGMGLIDKPEPIILQFYSEVLQQFRLAAEGHGDMQPPRQHRERIVTYFDPLPLWYQPFEEAAVSDEAFPLHAITQRPMAMYHSWGSQNAWLRQIHGENRLHIQCATAAKLGIADGDWVAVSSHHGRITAQAKLMDGVNPQTIWTWNAIGKRSGAWNLARDAREASHGFLLNHLISELLPKQDGRHQYANSDPVTGQGAWYDLRVRIEKVAAPALASEPQFAPLPTPPNLANRPKILRIGSTFRTAEQRIRND
jgi:anaerobic selenocysteine-containing dehydrogenase